MKRNHAKISKYYETVIILEWQLFHFPHIQNVINNMFITLDYLSSPPSNKAHDDELSLITDNYLDCKSLNHLSNENSNNIQMYEVCVCVIHSRELEVCDLWGVIYVYC